MWHRIRELSLREWAFLVGYGIVPVLAGMFVAGLAVDSIRAEHVGVPGVVVVEDCHEQEDGGGRGWRCSGPFVSDDGTIRLDAVSLTSLFAEPPAYGDEVPASVTGPSARRAHQPDTTGGIWGALVAVLLLGGGGRILVVQLRTTAVTPQGVSSADPDTVARLRQFAREWDLLPAPTDGTAVAPPVAAERTRANVAIWRVVASWLLLALSTGGVLWQLAAWNRDLDAAMSAVAVGTVTADRLGADDRIEVAYRDGDGTDRLVRLTPLDAGRLPAGSRVPLRYDPSHPEQVTPVQPELFALGSRDRNVMAGLALAPGFLLLDAWAWRLGRWALGTVRRPAPGIARVHAAHLLWGTEPTAFWLELHSGGRIWYQRVIWDRRLVRWLDGYQWGADHVPVSQARRPLPVHLRRCPGLRRMYLVDVAGVGRLWPASTARGRPPGNYQLDPVMPGAFGHPESAARHLGVVVALAVLAGIAWFLTGPTSSVYALTLVGAFAVWSGGAPWRGLYAVRPRSGPGHR
ncbi:hypothetical protein [Verrucosispora sp. NA02020]|uniref:hypothetical protein n=1 Tax=Verrucosispora sp. NA02020 TaxID=2742132 RepID=UPI001590E63B|nr:hypothetical protein [Verrucosispora sp. NA02020]QKW13562.1 hypothetical protein HUT12_12735 [Verrucosispora sp. NA02020]